MKILTNTMLISGEILDIINHSSNFLYLVSPYLQLENKQSSEFFSDQIDKALKNAMRKLVRILFITRDEKKEEIKEILKDYLIEGCKLIQIPNLHAKIYCNESRAVLTSMNLYLYSVLNSDEIGVLIDTAENLDAVKNYIENLIANQPIISKKDVKSKPWKERHEAKGFCKVCGTKIDFDPELKQTVCSSCYDEEIYSYEGEYCHLCGQAGKKEQSSMPLCKNCYYQHWYIEQYGIWKSNKIK